MANLGSILVGGLAVGTICGLSYFLGQNKILKFDEKNIIEFCKIYDDEFSPHKFYISTNQKCAIVFGANDKIILLKSMGNNYSIRNINKENIYQTGDFISFKTDDFAFPDFSEEFSMKIAGI